MKSGRVLFLAIHRHVFPNGNIDDKLVGVYSRRKLAHQAIEQLRTKPGFKELPGSFLITQARLDYFVGHNPLTMYDD
jgi:hypothetical protein